MPDHPDDDNRPLLVELHADGPGLPVALRWRYALKLLKRRCGLRAKWHPLPVEPKPPAPPTRRRVKKGPDS